MIAFRFRNLHLDGNVSNPPARADLLLRVVGDFELRANDLLLFTEQEFPLVELAAQLQQWLKTGGDFDYESMEAVEQLIHFGFQGETWLVEAGWPGRRGQVHVRNRAVLNSAVLQFIEDVKGAVRTELGIDSSPALV